jgi:hypothetical protein
LRETKKHAARYSYFANPEPRTSSEVKMNNHVYKILEIVGSSETSIEEAISTTIAQAAKL